MKILVLMVAVLALAAPATASAPARDPRVPAIQKQVRVLRAQVAGLEGRIAGAEKKAQTLDDRTNCLDVIELNYSNQNRWLILVTIAALTNTPQPAKPQVISDNGACARVGISNPGMRNLQSADALLDKLR